MELCQVVVPQKLQQFAGNKYTIKCLNEFLQTHNRKNIICLIGPDGSGKTLLSKLLFNKFNYFVLELGRNSLNGEDIKTVLQNFAKNKTIESFFTKQEKIVFVDDIDILTNIDKFILSKIIALNPLFIENGVKVFMTCNINDERKIQDCVKDIEIFKIYYPCVKDSYVYISSCLDNANIDYDADRLLYIVTQCKGNIRDSILSIKNTNAELDCKSQQRTFKDMNSFEIVKQILSQKSNINDIDYLMKGDLGVIPFILYENIVDELGTNYKFKKGKNEKTLLDVYMYVNKYFVDASNLEDFAYSNMDWTLINYSNTMKMYSIHNSISELERKQTTKDIKYRFSQLLSKMSHKNIMAKKVKNISNNANVSQSSVMFATDIHIQKLIKSSDTKIENNIVNNEETQQKKRGRKKKVVSEEVDNNKNKFSFTEGTCILSTYEKYFT
jgi:DNA polymerase III delta prime subunit